LSFRAKANENFIVAKAATARSSSRRSKESSSPSHLKVLSSRRSSSGRLEIWIVGLQALKTAAEERRDERQASKTTLARPDIVSGLRCPQMRNLDRWFLADRAVRNPPMPTNGKHRLFAKNFGQTESNHVVANNHFREQRMAAIVLRMVRDRARMRWQS
jgi:hypothetical protein